MAELNIEKNSFVRWPVSGGVALGQILNIKDSNASIETPTGSIVTVATDNLSAIAEEDYNQELENIATKLTKKRKGKEVNMSKANETKAVEANSDATVDAKMMEDMKTQCEKVEAEKAEALKNAEAAMKDLESMRTEAFKWKDQFEAAAAELATIKKEAMAKDRFSKIKSLDFIGAVAESETEAMTALAEMDEKTFNSIVRTATFAAEKAKAGQSSQPKATDQTQSNLPKATDQTQSNLPKATEASVADAKAAIENAKVDADASLVTASAEEVDEVKTLLQKFAQSAVKNKKGN